MRWPKGADEPDVRRIEKIDAFPVDEGIGAARVRKMGRAWYRGLVWEWDLRGAIIDNPATLSTHIGTPSTDKVRNFDIAIVRLRSAHGGGVPPQKGESSRRV